MSLPASVDGIHMSQIQTEATDRQTDRHTDVIDYEVCSQPHRIELK